MNISFVSFVNFCREGIQSFREADHTQKPDASKPDKISNICINNCKPEVRNKMQFECTVKKYVDPVNYLSTVFSFTAWCIFVPASEVAVSL